VSCICNNSESEWGQNNKQPYSCWDCEMQDCDIMGCAWMSIPCRNIEELDGYTDTFMKMEGECPYTPNYENEERVFDLYLSRPWQTLKTFPELLNILLKRNNLEDNIEHVPGRGFGIPDETNDFSRCSCYWEDTNECVDDFREEDCLNSGGSCMNSGCNSVLRNTKKNSCLRFDSLPNCVGCCFCQPNEIDCKWCRQNDGECRAGVPCNEIPFENCPNPWDEPCSATITPPCYSDCISTMEVEINKMFEGCYKEHPADSSERCLCLQNAEIVACTLQYGCRRAFDQRYGTSGAEAELQNCLESHTRKCGLANDREFSPADVYDITVHQYISAKRNTIGSTWPKGKEWCEQVAEDYEHCLQIRCQPGLAGDFPLCETNYDLSPGGPTYEDYDNKLKDLWVRGPCWRICQDLHDPSWNNILSSPCKILQHLQEPLPWCLRCILQNWPDGGNAFRAILNKLCCASRCKKYAAFVDECCEDWNVPAELEGSPPAWRGLPEGLDSEQLEYCEGCVVGWDGTEPMYEGSYDDCLDNIPRNVCEDPEIGGLCLDASCSLTFDWCKCGFDGLDSVCFGMLPTELCEGAGGSCNSNACIDFGHPEPGNWWSCVTINEYGNCECASISPIVFGGGDNNMEEARAACEAEGGTFSTDDCEVTCPRPGSGDFDPDFWACINSLRDQRDIAIEKCIKSTQKNPSFDCWECCQNAKQTSCLLLRLCYLEFDAQHGTNWGDQKYQECMDSAFDCSRCQIEVYEKSNKRSNKRSNKERQDFWEDYINKNDI